MAAPSIYELKKETDWLTVIPLTVWTLGAGALMLFLTIGIFISYDQMAALIPVVLFFSFIILLSLRAIRWQVWGLEVITITDDGINIESRHTFPADHIHISYTEIDSVDYDEDTGSRWLRRNPWQITGGKVRIHYLGRTRRVGQSIETDQAQGLAAALQQEIVWRKHAYRQRTYPDGVD